MREKGILHKTVRNKKTVCLSTLKKYRHISTWLNMRYDLYEYVSRGYFVLTMGTLYQGFFKIRQLMPSNSDCRI